MVRELFVVKIPEEWHTILKTYGAIKKLKPPKFGESIGEKIIAPALCQYPPIVEFIKEYNLKMPKCEET